MTPGRIKYPENENRQKLEKRTIKLRKSWLEDFQNYHFHPSLIHQWYEKMSCLVLHYHVFNKLKERRGLKKNLALGFFVWWENDRLKVLKRKVPPRSLWTDENVGGCLVVFFFFLPFLGDRWEGWVKGNGRFELGCALHIPCSKINRIAT